MSKRKTSKTRSKTSRTRRTGATGTASTPRETTGTEGIVRKAPRKAARKAPSKSSRTKDSAESLRAATARLRRAYERSQADLAEQTGQTTGKRTPHHAAQGRARKAHGSVPVPSLPQHGPITQTAAQLARKQTLAETAAAIAPGQIEPGASALWHRAGNFRPRPVFCLEWTTGGRMRVVDLVESTLRNIKVRAVDLKSLTWHEPWKR